MLLSLYNFKELKSLCVELHQAKYKNLQQEQENNQQQ